MADENLLPSEVTGENLVKATRTPKSWMPSKTVDVIEVAKSIVKSWKNSTFVISWVTSTKLHETVLNLETIFLAKNSSKGKRRSSTSEMSNLNKEGNFASGQVKHYIQSDHTKTEALSKYSEFGFEHRRNSYLFPKDSNRRLQSLKLMQQAIIDFGYGDREFGSAFWAAHIAKYIEYLDFSREGTKITSINIGEEETLKVEVLRILRGVSYMLASESVDDIERLRRSWGFLREKN